MALKDGKFSIKYLYKTLNKGDKKPFPPHLIITNALLPPKVVFFDWNVSIRKFSRGGICL